MNEQQNETEAADGQSELTAVLDANALNDAGWAFIDAWNSHTTQSMTGETWNNIKPMVVAAIRTYLKAANAKITGG